MKLILSESQFQNLVSNTIEEIAVQRKDIVGKGAYHMIYPSKQFPDRIYKIGDPEIVKRWYSVFVEHPHLFPEVYKKGLTKVTLPNGHQEMKAYVMIEKLNVVKFKNFWDVIDKISREKENMPLQLRVSAYEEGHRGYWNRMASYIDKDKELLRLYNEFIMLMDSVYEIFPSADLHKLNFGYDKKNNLKCLDI